jgi:hypothetical protein
MAAAKGGARGGGAPSQQTLSIRNRHIACLETLLNFNNPVDSKTSWQESWKILIYDTQCRDIISTLFKVADLRKHGVTLHLSLHSDRQPVQDVAALYLVEPTPENVQRIARDCSSGLYDSMHLNWSSSISQEQLHMLATAVAENESAQRVAKVVDQYMDFISLDHTLFSLNMADSFISLNDPQVSDADMERTIAKLVNSLFSVVHTHTHTHTHHTYTHPPTPTHTPTPTPTPTPTHTHQPNHPPTHPHTHTPTHPPTHTHTGGHTGSTAVHFLPERWGSRNGWGRVQRQTL